ncbi:MAG: hypothetical protein R2932_19050 [Caldilineaceae bacterium]
MEAGCAYRDWISLIKETPHGRFDISRLHQRAKTHLSEAIKLAETSDNFYRTVDGLVDLLVLYAAVGDRSLYVQTEQRLEAVIPKDHLITAENGGKPVSKDESTIFPFIGKLFALRGHREMEIHLSSEQPWRRLRTPQLENAIEQYFLSLQYYREFDADRDFRDLRRTTTDIHSRLQQLRSTERREINEILTKIEKKYHLSSSVLRDILQRRAFI